MALQLEIAALGSDAENDLRSLTRWIAEDETLMSACSGTLHSSGPPRSDHMGLGFDILQLALASGFSAGSLAVSIAAWLDARRGSPRLRLRRGSIIVELSAETSDDTLAAVWRLLGEEGAEQDHADRSGADRSGDAP
ncbi:hypothetical protein [Streptomyces sp. R35]|uniref:Uncharacterized protein n=1 Tax=Streptomyces sp. R35 TaxID=3238630 RepID=A0AB39S0H9_9ACTN